MPLRVDPGRDRKLYRLFRGSEPQSLKRGRRIYKRGEPARHLYLVKEGHVRLTLPKAGNGGEHTVDVVGPWEVFGEEALIPSSPRLYGAKAGEACSFVELEGEEAWKTLRRATRTYTAFLQSWREDVFRARATATGRASARTAARLADVLLELARRYGVEQGKEIVIRHGFSHQELADLAGAHRSTVTTTLNDWIYEGILREAYRGLVIAQPTELERRGSGGRLCPPDAVDLKSP